MRNPAVATLLLGLAGCAGAAAGGPASRATVGAELVQAGQATRLGATLARASGGSAFADAASLDAAADRLLRDGRVLEGGGTVTDPGAALPPVLARLQAVAARDAASGPAGAVQAGQMQGCADAFLAAARFYNQDAAAAGVPKAALP